MKNFYRHTQYSPLCFVIYGMAIFFFAMVGVLREETVIQWVFPPVGVLMLCLAGSFHHLTVEDQKEQLSIRFGPLPLFRRSVKYENMTSLRKGRTTILDGWGIHKSLGGGWVWNLWGRDCVVIQMRHGLLKLGTDDAEQLVEFLKDRLSTLDYQNHPDENQTT